MDRILNDYVFDCIARGYAHRTVESYQGRIQQFLQWRGSYDITTIDLRRFLLHLRNNGYKAPTLNGYFAALSSFYDFLEFEELVNHNPVPKFRKRYLRNYKKQYQPEKRQLINIFQMRQLIQETDQLLYQTLFIFLAKTGLRRKEILSLDKSDISLQDLTVHVKPTAKRSNTLIYFDQETRTFLETYLASRKDSDPSLFVGRLSGKRIRRNQVYDAVTRYALRCGIHNPNGRLDEKFTTHCFRHWFTTWLRRSGMPREFIQELRGDTRGDAIDVYDHVQPDELKKTYLECIPQLGISP